MSAATDLPAAGDDALNEYLVELAYQRMVAASCLEDRVHWCNRLSHYVKQRSPATIAAMEVARGLRR